MDGSCHMMSRKKRRGLIEKRRRDRINNSLHELKRLVPAAFEKQGSAKLEKAEILQLTVDHLRMLASKGKHPPLVVLLLGCQSSNWLPSLSLSESSALVGRHT